jgi:membrane peptidoglycan carboxypeptidase
VLAYYGGSNGAGLDYAQAWRQPGSSFKPYVLATALTRTLAGKKPAYTIDSVFNGASPQKVDGFEIHNDPTDPSTGYYTLSQAMTLSLNTVFYKLASLVGPANVAKLAHAAGIPLKQTGSGPEPGALTLQDADGHVGDKIGIGGYEVRPIDQAVGYATLANGGTEHDAYFVQRVVDASGNRIYQHEDHGTKAINPKVVNDTTLSMEKVASTSQIALDGNRPVAAKTGTVGIADSPNSSDAWTVGFTPQVAVASWAGSNTLAPIYDDYGNSMYGRENPGTAWQLFMNAYLANKPVKALPTTQQVGVSKSQSTAPATNSAPATTSAPPSTTAPATTSAPPSTTAPSTPPVQPTAPVTQPPASPPASNKPSATCTPGVLNPCG